MGIITSVERQKRPHRYNIFVDEKFAFAVHEDVLIKHHLFKGQSVEPDLLEQVLYDEERQEAYLKVIRWLGSRQRTELEIRSYLQRKDYAESVSDDCLSRLKRERYIDDERYSAILAEERLKRQGKGKMWVRQELLHKGVDKDTVQEVVASIKADDEAASAAAVARKRWNTLAKQEDQASARRKLYGYLARRGFSPSVISKAIREATGGERGIGSAENWE